MSRLMLAALGVAALAPAANAVFTGLFIDVKGTTLMPGPGFWSNNIYACFDSPTDRALSVTAANLRTCGGVQFYQNPFGGATEPNPALVAVFPDLAFDTFVTIGLKFQGPPGTPVTALEPGSSMTQESFTGGWFTDGDAPQGLPQPITGQPGFYVLLAQLTIENPTPTSGFHGEMTIAWKTATSGAQFSEVNFTSFPCVPAPGAAAVLAIVGIAGCRRRR
jgi:hypothetical protein